MHSGHMHVYNLLQQIVSGAFCRFLTPVTLRESLRCRDHTQAPTHTQRGEQPDRLCVLPLICWEIYGLGVRLSSPDAAHLLPSATHKKSNCRGEKGRQQRRRSYEVCVWWTVKRRRKIKE